MGPSVKSFPAQVHVAEKIANRFGAQLGRVNIQKFSDGEFQPVFLKAFW